MLRKIFILVRTLLIGAGWTYVFLPVVNLVFIALWNFSFFSASSWHTIRDFWQIGGVIKTAPDYLFLFMLIMVIPLWLWGWKRLTRVDYAAILLFPVNAYNRHIINKYGHDSKRIILRNLKSSREAVEAVKNQIESIKPESPREVKNIREEIQKKIESETSKF